MTVREPSQDELLRLWESAVPLEPAWRTFAVSLDDFALDALQLHPEDDLKALGIDNPRYKELVEKGWLPSTREGRQKKLAIITQNERIHLLREIYAGYLWAIGSRTLPNGSHELVRLPRQYFLFDEAAERKHRPEIHWSEGELTVGGTSYFDIRIVPAPREMQEQVEPSISEEGRSVTRQGHEGRPETKDKITEAIRELWPDAEFQALENRTEQARALRARLLGEAARGSDAMQGYKTSTLKRLIGEHATAQRMRKTE